MSSEPTQTTQHRNEQQFQQGVLPETLTRTKIALWAFTLLNVISAVVEIGVIEPDILPFVLIIRITAIIATALIFYSVFYKKRHDQIVLYNNLCIVLLLTTAIALNILFATPAIIDSMAVLLIYSYMPGNLSVKAVCCSALGIVDSYLAYLLYDVSTIAEWMLLHAFAQYIGIVMCRQLTADQRATYWALQDEKKLREDLQLALREVKQLSGLLPICSVCKKIRDEEQNWTAIENYISQHSEADFTHGYCPSCFKNEMKQFNVSLGSEKQAQKDPSSAC